jgi:hypothetical protein
MYIVTNSKPPVSVPHWMPSENENTTMRMPMRTIAATTHPLLSALVPFSTDVMFDMAYVLSPKTARRLVYSLLCDPVVPIDATYKKGRGFDAVISPRRRTGG